MAEMGIFVALPILNRGSASLAAEMPLKSVKNIHNVFFPQFFFLFLSLFFYNIFFLWWVEVDFFHDFPLILPSEFFFISIFSFRFFFLCIININPIIQKCLFRAYVLGCKKRWEKKIHKMTVLQNKKPFITLYWTTDG